jgi:hypothetical protein
MSYWNISSIFPPPLTIYRYNPNPKKEIYRYYDEEM